MNVQSIAYYKNLCIVRGKEKNRKGKKIIKKLKKKKCSFLEVKRKTDIKAKQNEIFPC